MRGSSAPPRGQEALSQLLIKVDKSGNAKIQLEEIKYWFFYENHTSNIQLGYNWDLLFVNPSK